MKTNFLNNIALSFILGALFLTNNNSAIAADKLITSLEKTSGVSKNKEIPQGGTDRAASTKNSYSSPGIISGRSKKIDSHTVMLGLGQSILYGDFSDIGEDEISPEIYYTYKASHSFDFLANFHYNDQELGSTSAVNTGLALGIKGRIMQYDSFAPFAVGGLGFYRPVVERNVNNRIVRSEGKLTLGSHLGVGVELDLNEKANVGVIYHYHNPFDVKQDASLGGQVEGSYGKLLLLGGYTF